MSQSSGTAAVEFRGVSRAFSDLYAIHELDLQIAPGEFLTLLGPSGCGKTTALRLLAGFLVPTSGMILINKIDVTYLPPQRREIGMVFQDYALFPHLTVQDNIAFGLVERRESKAKIESTVTRLLRIVSLTGLGLRYPSQLSGGQKQRVAVARALAVQPTVLLMDEPLGALDVKLRAEMQSELRRIQREARVTTLYVTHDQDEAFNVSDRIVVMRHGRVMQMGSPREIYEQPRTPFVADFVGKINLLRGQWMGVSGERASIQVEDKSFVAVPTRQTFNQGKRVVVGIRPEHMQICAPKDNRGACADESPTCVTQAIGSLRR